jgi:hypothetical protein
MSAPPNSPLYAKRSLRVIQSESDVSTIAQVNARSREFTGWLLDVSCTAMWKLLLPCWEWI